MSNKNPEEEKTDEQVFVEFHYHEVKDLTKHFLTLISGTLVLSVTFAEQIVPLATAAAVQQWLLGLCWVGLLASLVLAGFGLYTNYLAAEKAKGSIIYDYPGDFRSMARRSYALLDVSAVLYGLALSLLAATAASRFFYEI